MMGRGQQNIRKDSRALQKESNDFWRCVRKPSPAFPGLIIKRCDDV